MRFKCTHATNDTDYDDIAIVIPAYEIDNATKAMHSIVKNIPESVRWVTFRSNADIVDDGISKCTDLSMLNMWKDGDIYVECDLDGVTYEAQAGVWK